MFKAYLLQILELLGVFSEKMLMCFYFVGDEDDIPTNESGTPAISESKSTPQVTLRKKCE